MGYIRLDYLRDACGDDDGLMAELVQIFKEQALALGPDLDSLLARADYDALARSAHKFRSTALSLGLDDVADALKKIEVIGKKIFMAQPSSATDDAARRLYLSQINGLTPAIDQWTDAHLDTDSLMRLIGLVKERVDAAVAEATQIVRYFY